MDAAQYRVLFESEDTHWFFEGQWAIADRILDAWLPAKSGLRILDAGCGTGGTSTRLATRGDVFGTDVSVDAVRFAQRRSVAAARSSIEQLPFADQTFDLVTCFDVLYHRGVEDDRRALSELLRVLRPKGFLLVRVPAFEWLRRAHDEAVHGARRYTREELAAKLRAASFDVRVCSYANLISVPAVLGKRVLEKLQPAASADLDAPPRWMNRILAGALSMEARWVARGAVPFGVSVVALAQRI